MVTVMESIRETLSREAVEAEMVAEEEERGEREPQPGRRGRRPAVESSQVYSVRVPVERLEQLRRLAEQRGVAPTALMRQFVLERLDQESTIKVVTRIERDPQELRLGPSRRTPLARVRPLPVPASGSNATRRRATPADDERRQERRA
jgi:hypothetical protein